MSEAVRIGVLGRGTVGGAFVELVGERAGAVEAATGRRPEVVGVLRRSVGDFDEILAASDIVVELIGGTDPARDYVLRALREGKHVVSANKQLIAQHGDELFDAARESGVQLRFEAAVAGVIPVIRVIPVSLDDVAFEGIQNVQPDDLAYAKEFGLSLKLLGVAERHGEGVSVRVFPCFLYRGHPLAPVEGPFNAVMVEAPSITEITMSGPGAGGVETASAVLGDVASIVAGRAPVHAVRERLEVVRDGESAFYLPLEGADRPGVLAQIAAVLGDNQVSVKSVVQWGLGDDARLVMVMHRCAESGFHPALGEMDELEFLRSPPRAIRVIEEEFV